MTNFVPMMQLLEKGFVPRFTSIVDQAGIDHHRICIEFTERAIIENFRQVKTMMDELTREGFRFFLDDFGEGYSNFNCILQLPFQMIKLDRSLLRADPGSSANSAFLCNLTKLLHELGEVVIAEGAETQDEVNALTEMGVDRIQGFALAMPMPADKLVQFYREHPLDLV